jgi:hypothetical protein
VFVSDVKSEVNNLQFFPLWLTLIFFSKIAAEIVVHLQMVFRKVDSSLSEMSGVFSGVGCGVRKNYMNVIKQRLQQACMFFTECI